jgi:hypothetical protein
VVLRAAKRVASLAEMSRDLEDLAPGSRSCSSRPVTKHERGKLAARRVGRRIAIGLGALAVVGSTVMLGVLYLRSRAGAEPMPTVAESMLAPQVKMGFTETNGAQTDRGGERDLRLADGNERVFAVSYGRPARFHQGSVRFEPREDASAGHALLMAQSSDADTIELSAKVRIAPIDESMFGRLQRFLIGAKPRPAAGLLLAGGKGRYVALIASMEEPIALEWALGEKRGRTLLDQSTATNAATLSMRIEPDGRLIAHATLGDERSPVGEPLRLGAGWKREFGLSAPLPGLGCAEASCVFDELLYGAGKVPPRPPPPPPVVQAAEEPRPVIVKKIRRAKKKRRR